MLVATFTVAIYIIFQMILVWILAHYLKNPSIIDMFWPIGLMIAGLIYLSTANITLRLIVISSLLIVWAIRLSGFLYFTRIRKKISDKRYQMISENWKMKHTLGFFLNFQIQGFFTFIISIVFLFISTQTSSHLNWLDYLGIILCIIGIIGETISDFELTLFKKQHDNKVCNIGLWRFSRHPNCFFDWVTWCGFTCFALQSSFGWMSLCSPILLLLIMVKITIPITERGSILSKGKSYLIYQRKTSIFFPWFNKE